MSIINGEACKVEIGIPCLQWSPHKQTFELWVGVDDFGSWGCPLLAPRLWMFGSAYSFHSCLTVPMSHIGIPCLQWSYHKQTFESWGPPRLCVFRCAHSFHGSLIVPLSHYKSIIYSEGRLRLEFIVSIGAQTTSSGHGLGAHTTG